MDFKLGAIPGITMFLGAMARDAAAQPRVVAVTTTIEREWLAQIVAGTKKIEYREIKPYWTKRFTKVSLPFELRLPTA